MANQLTSKFVAVPKSVIIILKVDVVASIAYILKIEAWDVEFPEPWLRYIRGTLLNKPTGSVSVIVLTFIESPPYVCVEELVVVDI